MDLEAKHTLLLVDDEGKILNALKRLFRKQGFRILTAESGQQALDTLKQEEASVSLIISDQRMPGMNGATFLTESMTLAPDAIRFLLTGYSDMDAVVDAVNNGKIHRYLVKPWNDAELLLYVNEALRQVELKQENLRLTALTQKQNKELLELNQQLEERVEERTWALKTQNKKLKQLNKGLEKSLTDSIRLLLSLVESSNPKLGAHMKATGKLARQIAASAGLEERLQNQVEMAGLVHDIGLLGMSEQILEKDERSMSPKEFDAYAHHPEIAALSLSSVAELKEVGKIVSAHHENIDGSGFPHGIQGKNLNTGARILAIAADYCTMIHLWPKVIRRMISVAARYTSQDALNLLEYDDEASVRDKIAQNIITEGAGKRYDAAFVSAFLTCIGSDPNIKTIQHLPFDQLGSGLVLADDLRMKDGRLLLTRGTELNRSALKVIHEIGARGKLDGMVAVLMPLENDAGRKASA
jgi:response regulator RpfG family c-di-GMP phosphodiesterase